MLARRIPCPKREASTSNSTNPQVGSYLYCLGVIYSRIWLCITNVLLLTYELALETPIFPLGYRSGL